MENEMDRETTITTMHIIMQVDNSCIRTIRAHAIDPRWQKGTQLSVVFRLRVLCAILCFEMECGRQLYKAGN